MSVKRKMNRRKFLGEASCAALGSTTFLSSLLQLGMINTIAGSTPKPEGDYKALVCILLAGGIDSHNVILPKGDNDNEYAEYQTSRGTLALAQNSILGINHQVLPNGREYGLHPTLTDMANMFDNSNLALLSNVGTLIQPINNKTEYSSGNKLLPLGLYSHSDQIMQWQTSVPQSRDAVGWGGRAADLLKSMNSIDTISMNISLSGQNRFQAGNTVMEYSINDNATAQSIGISSYPSWWSDSGFLTQSRNLAIDSLVGDVYNNIFQSTYANLGKQSLESVEILKIALQKIPALNTAFNSTGLSKDLRMMANLMSVRNELGAQRQIFFTTFGGWDHHDNVITSQNNMLPVLNEGIRDFYAALTELGLQDSVTTFTISDFARTLTSNGNGSDHAWGGNQLIAGGAVQGKKLYGTYPSLALTDNDLNVSSRGRIIPTTSTDEFFAELALWFGVSPNDLNYILPNIGNFYNVNSGVNPIGFMPPI